MIKKAMKLHLIVFLLFILTFGLIGYHSQKDPRIVQKDQKSLEKFPVLKGEYLGQIKPGLEPEIFAPGIISTGNEEHCSVFSPDGKEFWFTAHESFRGVILFMKQENNRWGGPQVAPFSGKYNNLGLCFSTDGNTFYFCSGRSGSDPWNYDIWKVERSGAGWTEPQSLGSPVNSSKGEGYLSFTKDGTIYFSSLRDGGKGVFDIYYSRLVDGHYTEAKNVGDSINTKFAELDPCIAPDESFLIFASIRPDNKRGTGRPAPDLYISFRNEDGSWTNAKNAGDKINSNYAEICPYLSPDGKYLFFTSNRVSKKFVSKTESKEMPKNPGNGKPDIYWVDSKVIDLLRSEKQK